MCRRRARSRRQSKVDQRGSYRTAQGAPCYPIFLIGDLISYPQLAASVAKSIEYKRAQLDKQVRVRFRSPLPIRHLTSRFALTGIL